MNATLPSTRPVIAALSASLLVLVCPAAVTMPLRRDLPRAAAASLRLSSPQARARIGQGDNASGQARPGPPWPQGPGHGAGEPDPCARGVVHARRTSTGPAATSRTEAEAKFRSLTRS